MQPWTFKLKYIAACRWLLGSIIGCTEIHIVLLVICDLHQLRQELSVTAACEATMLVSTPSCQC